ncbi:hypothetical protein PWT90_04710 [Aphanocladium album]|nr:hypothetical protein PWT90_04710 [Aphanocladium album]
MRLGHASRPRVTLIEPVAAALRDPYKTSPELSFAHAVRSLRLRVLTATRPHVFTGLGSGEGASPRPTELPSHLSPSGLRQMSDRSPNNSWWASQRADSGSGVSTIGTLTHRPVARDAALGGEYDDADNVARIAGPGPGWGAVASH